MRRLALSLALVSLAGLTTVSAAVAAPADPGARVPLHQPDGTTFVARPFGDEWSNGLETTAGYTVARDAATREWRYAVRGAGGSLRAGSVRADRPAPPGFLAHLRSASAPSGAPGGSATPGPGATGPNGSPVPPNTGTQRSLVILVQFLDQASLGTTPANWSARFFGASDSVKDYYAKASFGNLDVEPGAESFGTANDGVAGWITLARNHPNIPTLGDPAGSVRDRQTIHDAIVAANPYVNYATYDTNHDGELEPYELHITVIMAGWEGAEECGSPAVWGHQWVLDAANTPTVDGVAAGGNGFTTFGEKHCSADNSFPARQATLGIIVHELGHDLGWPDLYDTGTDVTASYGGVGYWSIMSYGVWLHQAGGYPGSTPSLPDAFSKYYQGWIAPTAVNGTVAAATAQAEDNPSAFRLRDNPGGVDWTFHEQSGTGEYFLVENRQRVGYDAALPGCGVLVWHIDESVTSSNAANATDAHRLVDLEEADNSANHPFDAADAWIGDRTFDDASTPNSHLYSGAASNVSASSFGACGATMTPTLSTTGGGGGGTVPNDAFGAAASITRLPYSRTGLDTTGATANDAAEPVPSCPATGMGHTVWFRYTAPANGTLTATTATSLFDTVLAVYRGTALNALTPVDCNDDVTPGADATSRLTFDVTAGQTYVFQVGGFKDGTGASDSGTLAFGLSAAAPPNDAFPGAADVGALQFTATGVDTTGATAAGEPAPPCVAAGMGNTVWYRYQPAADANVTIDTEGSTFDTVLSLYEGTTLAGLTPVTGGCSDDIDHAAGNDRSRIRVPVLGGHTYYVQAGGYNYDAGAAQGGLTLHVTAGGPVNDTFEGAAAVTLGDAPVVQTADTTPEAEAAACAPLGNTVWYRYTAPAGGRLAATTLTSGFDTVLAVYTGPDVAHLTEVGCNDDVDVAAGPSVVVFDAAGGTTYWFQAGGYRDATTATTETGALHFHLGAGPPHTTFTSGPAEGATVASRSVSIGFHATGADSFQCVLDDAAAWTACTSPYTRGGLADGTHSLAVRAVRDLIADPDPAVRTWTVDATAPNTAIAGSPAEGALTPARTAAFTFTSEPSATFQCRRDGGAWASCGSPAALSGLGDGAHSFEVRARDRAGNVDATPAARRWSVDGTPPDTVLTGGPASGSTVTTRSVTLGFASDPGATFECRLDGGPWQACGSPVAYDGLADGVHAFAVRARDAAGNLDETPAAVTWTVDATDHTTLVAGQAVPRQFLGAVLTRGLKVTLQCSAACNAGWKLVIGAAEARRLGLGARKQTIGKGAAVLPAAGRRTIAIKLTPRARRKLRRASKVKLTLIARVSGHALAPRTIRLRR